MFLVLTPFSLSALHSPLSLNYEVLKVSFSTLFSCTACTHPIGSAYNRPSAALFSVLFYDKTANEFRKGVEIVDSLSEWALEGSHSSLPSRNFWQVAWHPQLEQLRKRNSFLTEEIHVAFEQFQRWKGFVICLIVSILGFWTYQNKHNLYCHTTSFKILTTIIISWNCFPFRIYKFLHLFLI